MWFNPSNITERIQEAMSNVAKLSPSEQDRRKEAERAVEESGVGVCQFCDEEIVKNDSVPGGGWVWESELLIGFCEKAGNGHKHKPRVYWSPDEGVVNA